MKDGIRRRVKWHRDGSATLVIVARRPCDIREIIREHCGPVVPCNPGQRFYGVPHIRRRNRNRVVITQFTGLDI